MNSKRDCEYRMEVGQITLGLICPSADYAESLARYFQSPSGQNEPDLRLRLEIVAGDSPVEIPNNLFRHKTLHPGGFSIAGDLISGSYDPVARSGVVRVRDLLTKGPLTRVFEQFLYQAFYSARRAAAYDALLIHSSGVIRAQDGFLFVGASEAGKSTIAELSRDRIVTNDEMNLIEFSAAGPILSGTPFNGLFAAKEPAARAPLRAILLLDKGPIHRLDQIRASECVTRIASQIAPPVAIEAEMNQGTGLDLLDLATRLNAVVPVRKLTFLPDAGFWATIDEAFPPKAESTPGV